MKAMTKDEYFDNQKEMAQALVPVFDAYNKHRISKKVCKAQILAIVETLSPNIGHNDDDEWFECDPKDLVEYLKDNLTDDVLGDPTCMSLRSSASWGAMLVGEDDIWYSTVRQMLGY